MTAVRPRPRLLRRDLLRGCGRFSVGVLLVGLAAAMLTPLVFGLPGVAVAA